MRFRRVSGRALRRCVGLRCVSSSPFPLPPPATTVRSKGYGPTKDLLKGVDISKRLVVETELHPADAELQRRVLSLSAADVSVRTPLEGEVNFVDNGAIPQQEEIVSISSEQLASVATVIVEQVKEKLELSSYTSEAAQDARSSGVVNAVADCLRQEMERLSATLQTQEVSFSRMLGENSDVICARIASVIQKERSLAAANLRKTETKHLSSFTQEVTSAVANLETSLKKTLVETIAAKNKKMVPIFEDVCLHVVGAIEQASRTQQEQLAISLQDVLERTVISAVSPDKSLNLDAIQGIVQHAMERVVEGTQNKVQELLKDIRKHFKKSTIPIGDASDEKQLELEGLLNSYGERLEELRESTAGLTDVKELLMDVHSLQQTNEVAVQEVRDSIKRLKKDLMGVLRGATSPPVVEAVAEDKNGMFAEYCDKLADVADRVTSTVEQQLKKQSLDVKELLTQVRTLEKTFGETKKSAVVSIPSMQELDDDRMVTLAQSISDSILASLPPREALPKPAPAFTKEDLVEAVSAVLGPKLDELAAAVAKMETPRPSTVTVSEVDEGATGLGEQQLITLAQTIAESVRDVVQDVVPAKELMESLTSREDDAALMARLESLKETIIATVQEEMGRTHEVDLTPFQNYLDQVLAGVQEAIIKQQEATQVKVESVVETLLGQLQKQQKLLVEGERARQRSSDDDARPPIFTVEELATLNNRLLGEINEMLTSNSTSLLSSLEAVQREVRATADRLPENLETRLSSVENSIHESYAAGKDHNASVKTALKDIQTGVEIIKGGNDAAGQVLASINKAVSDLARSSTASVDGIKEQLSATENRTEGLYTKMTSDLSRHFSQLQTEVQDGRRRIEELISSQVEYKGVSTSVEAMRLKLEEVSRLLENMKNSVFNSPPSEPQHRPPPPQEQQQQQQQQQTVSGEFIESQLKNLSVVTQEILSEVQKYRSAQEAPAPADATSTKENLEAMEVRLNERLQGLYSKLNEMTQADADAAAAELPSEEVPSNQGSVSEDVSQHLKNVDILIKHLQTSRSAQVKQMREKLIVLRSFLATGGLNREEGSTIKTILGALDAHRLKLREEAAGAEAALVKDFNVALQQTLERLFSSSEQTVAESTKHQLLQLQSDLDAKSERIETQQQHVASQLNDRLNNLEKLQEGHTVVLTKEIQNGHKEWRDVLNLAIKQEMPTALQGVIVEACTEPLRSVRDKLDKRDTREEQRAATLLSRVQEVSRDVSKLGGLGAEMQAAVSRSSATIIEEILRTQKGLAERFEGHVSTMVRKEFSNVSSHIVTGTPFSTTMVTASTPLSLWWLCVLSFVVFATIMACAYFIFAAFLVAFVPVPPPEGFLANAGIKPAGPGDTADLPKKFSSSRVVDQVME
ncbi:protein p166 [Trypanosoma cruzi]|nr:protein p166 [Trypanosoma cruzi]